MRVRPVLAWYALWVGIHWDREEQALYVLPLPGLGVKIEFDPDPFWPEGVPTVARCRNCRFDCWSGPEGPFYCPLCGGRLEIGEW
jgi:hypothetical protein